MNHFKTNSARFSGSGSLAGAQKRVGCSAQYAEYSTMDCGERRKGGAVSDARSPLKVANDYRLSVPIFFLTGRRDPDFDFATGRERKYLNE